MANIRLFHFIKFLIHKITKYSEQCSLLNNYVFALWGLMMHLILLWGILDINFHSPIIQGLPVVLAPRNAPAKRLLLFVADGLRYRTFKEATPSYLGQIMKNHSSWGISHTRMPTESRPGNVAIAAGLYEDPSALFKGWKENPVDFDSVFNQSHFTWAWGSPDIIPMFMKGAKGNMFGESYSSDWQDFREYTLRLDSWVFDKYSEWLQEKGDSVKDLNGIILFFHLLGCDNAGHFSKPFSREYIENMNYVDQKIQETVRMTENFFGNGSTAYIFTADHGMTDWGSHGSGSTDETETPLIVWGAGTNIIEFQDVEQADITPLISALIGISIPVNNEGVLPRYYLNASNQEYTSRVLLSNLKQLMHQVKANCIISCANSGRHTNLHEEKLNNKIYKIEQYIKAGQIMEAIKESDDAAMLTKEYLLYFRQYQKIRFLVYLSMMWFGWITLLFFKLSGVYRQNVNRFLLQITNVAFASLLIITFLVHKVSDCNNWRIPYYASFAIISLWLAVRNIMIYSPKLIIYSFKRSCIEIAGTVILLLLMYIGLTHRQFLSIGMVLTAFIQKVLLKNANHLYFVTALTLAIFPLLPVVEPQPRIYIVLGSICIMLLSIMLREQTKRKKIMEITRLLTTALVYLGFIDGRHFTSWIILTTTPLCIWTYPTKVKERIEGITFGLFCPLALLSASYEPLFFLTFAVHLLSWPQSASHAIKDERSLLTTEDVIKATFFMLYTLLCFFGTGNMASISSFDPSWTRHFITIFSPFIMFSLILFKLSIPLILIGCASNIFSSYRVFLAILLLGDYLSLPLIYCVTPQGSWLDIGSTISRFTIVITLPCLVLLLHYLSRPFIRFKIKESYFTLRFSEKKHIV